MVSQRVVEQVEGDGLGIPASITGQEASGPSETG